MMDEEDYTNNNHDVTVVDTTTGTDKSIASVAAPTTDMIQNDTTDSSLPCTAVSIQQQQQQQQPIVDMEDVWATSEGYTPLQDFVLVNNNYNHDGNNTDSDENNNNNNNNNSMSNDHAAIGAFFSDGTTGGTIYTSFPGAFYANISQQHNNDNDDDWDDMVDDDDDDEVEEGDGYRDYNYLHNDNDDDDDVEGTTTTATITTTSSTSLYDSIPDYRSVADSALLMLDREYNNIIALEQQHNLQQQHAQIYSDGSCHTYKVYNEEEEDEEYKNLNEDSEFLMEEENVMDADTHEDSMKCESASLQQYEPTSLLETTLPPIEPKHIDTDAVRRAVQTIQLKNPKFEQNLRIWETTKRLQPFMTTPTLTSEQQHQSQNASMTYKHNTPCLAPRLHPIIPEIPLAAFRKLSSTKAMQATANLTRSTCIAEAIHRYNILQYHINTEQTIRIHVVGCDHVEIGYHNTNTNSSDATVTGSSSKCYDINRIRTVFGPIVRWMGAYAEAPSHIQIELIGPNIPVHVATASKTTPIDLLPSKRSSSSLKECLQSATLRCHSGTYEDILQSNDDTNDIGIPDLVLAFNAGIWGYQEWDTTIRYLIQSQSHSVPFVITAYTFEEAEDDYDTIAEIVKQYPVDHKKVQCVWDVEHNPFSSNQEHKVTKATTTTTTTSIGSLSRRRENAAWQSWKL